MPSLDRSAIDPDADRVVRKLNRAGHKAYLVGGCVRDLLVGRKPKDDEKIAYSLYPNGLDPAPIVATTGQTPIRIARVRPLDKAPTAPRGLELGTLSDDGAFTGSGNGALKPNCAA